MIDATPSPPPVPSREDRARILLVDDDPTGLHDVVSALQGDLADPAVLRVGSMAELRQALAERWDAALVEMHATRFDALQAMALVREKQPFLPLLAVSRVTADHQAVDALRAGAHDYLPRHLLARLPSALDRAIRENAHRRSAAEMAARFRDTFEQTAVGIVHGTLDGQIIRANRRFADMLGYTPEELVGMRFRDLILAGEPVFDGARISELMAPEGRCQYEKRFASRDGRPVWSSITLSMGGDGDRYVIGVVEDITARREAEERSRESEARYRELMEQASDAIFISDPAGAFIDANRSACALTGFTRDEIVAHTAADLLDDSDIATRLREIGERKRLLIERQLVRADGSTIPVEISATQLSDGRVQQIVRDIRERKAAEETLRQSEERFRLVSEVANDGVFDWDVAADSVWSNDRFYELFGDAPRTGWARLEWWHKRIHPEDRDLVYEKSLSETALHRLSSSEYRFIRDDGAVIHVIEHRRAFSSAEGRVTRVIGTMTDVTQSRLDARSVIESERKFRLLFETGAVGIAFWRWDGTVVDANDAYLQITGYDRDDLVAGRLNWRSLHRTTPMLEQAIEEVRSRGSASPGQQVYLRKDGSEIPVLVSPALLRGETYEGVSVVLDMTGQVRATEALRESEERFRTLIENSHDVVAIIAPDGTIMYESPPVERLLGYTPEELVGRGTFDYIHPEDRERVLQVFSEAVVGRRESGHAEYRYLAKDGTYRWLESVGRNMIDTPIGGVVINSRDVTERRAWQRRLEQAERLSSLGRLAATIAHEFNNVLMGIQPFAEVLKRRLSDDDRAVAACTHIENSVRRGKRITQEILRFTHAAEPAIASVAVEEWLEEIAAEVRGLLPVNTHLALHPPSKPAAMAADRPQLTQALTNLVLNARDAMPSGGTITLSVDNLKADGFHVSDIIGPAAFVHIAVKDEGVGMAAGVQQHIFEPLFTTKKGGTGLGLAIVHQIVTRHGGHIFVESTPGEGTAFHLYIPRAEVADSRVEAPPQEAPLPRRGRILLVEDERAVADGLRAILEMAGYTVSTAYSGAEAQHAVVEFEPDVLVLDVGLPDIDGVELYKLLLKGRAPIATIFSTGHGDAGQLERIAASDRVRFLQKPYASDALLAVIDEVME